ncbi:FecR domain-containing protein [Acidovorax sp. 106]|uniref:FecR family protein n=1 Tax=Acidovorax sp. 106 TaxID=2135637 RepID=UPI001F293BCA|nr:FecR domain-containing protein [Acidovorax sp. 106]
MHPSAPLQRLPSALLAAGLVLSAFASTLTFAADRGDEIPHTVQPGDTLEGLAQSYLAAPQLWPRLQARNKVKDPKHLQPGSVVWIPVDLQPAESASVEFVHGDVKALPPTPHGKPGNAATTNAPLAAGSTLAEGTKLEVGPDAFIAVRLADGSIVRVNAQSDVQLRQLRRRGRAGSVQSVLEVQRGSVESTVTPSSDRLRRFEVRTPRAVTSVRGTRFGVALSEEGKTTAAVLQGAVAVQSRTGGIPVPGNTPAALLQPGQGLAVQADGTVGSPRPLLPAPDLQTLPKAVHEPGLLALDVPPQPESVAYQAVVARDADLTQVLRSGTFANGRLRWPGLEDGPYYLSVRSVDAAGIAGLPATQPLTIKTQPVPPLYQQPAAAGVVSNAGGQLLCTQVPGVRWYRIQVAADAAFTQPALDEARLDSCRLSVASLPVGNYFWRAASVRELAQGQADQGPFAAAQSFVLAQQPPTLSAQSMQASDGDTTVNLRWQAQAGQRFRLQLARDIGFEKPTLDTTLDEPQWTAADLAAGTYFVRIQVLDPSGLQSDFSPPRSIRVGTGFSTSSGLPVSDSSGEAVRRP